MGALQSTSIGSLSFCCCCRCCFCRHPAVRCSALASATKMRARHRHCRGLAARFTAAEFNLASSAGAATTTGCQRARVARLLDRARFCDPHNWRAPVRGHSRIGRLVAKGLGRERELASERAGEQKLCAINLLIGALGDRRVCANGAHFLKLAARATPPPADARLAASLPTGPPVRSLFCSLLCCLHSFTHSLVRSFARSLIHSLARSSAVSLRAPC